MSNRAKIFGLAQAWGVATAALSIGQMPGPGPLYPLAQYAAGGAPIAITSADWNQDGFADLAAANNASSANSLSMLAGRGDGTFAQALHISVGPQPEDLATGDWNGDGAPDLAAAAQDGAWIALGLGPLGFAPAANYPSGGQTRGLTGGDYNGDGQLDLVLTNADVSSVGALLGLGNGSFEPFLLSNAGPTPRAIASGDFDGDGELDALITNDPNPLFTFLRGRGNGTFHVPVFHPVGVYPYCVAVADIDLDGDLDAAVGHYLGATDIAHGTGNGGFTMGTPLPLPAGDCTGLSLGDLDLDGDPDLVTPGYGNLYENLAGQGFGPPQALSARGADAVMGDWDCDGLLDLAFADNDYDWKVVVVPGLGGLAFESLPEYPIPGFAAVEYLGDLVAADIDGDGRLDLAASHYNSYTAATLYFNQGAGVLGPPVTYEMNAMRGGVGAPDLDGDGLLDVLVTEGHLFSPGPPRVCVRLGLGGGALGLLREYTGIGSTSVPGIALGDLDADGDPDLVGASSGIEVAVFLGPGDGSFVAGPGFTVPGGNPTSHGRPIGLADFDRDGLLDLALGLPESQSGDGDVALLGGNGDGSFGAPLVLAISSGVVAASSLAVGDADLDGDADVVVGGLYAGGWVLEGDGTLNLGAPVQVVPDTDPAPSALADLNGDEWPDLVCQGLRAVVPGLGGLAFGAPLYFHAPATGWYHHNVVVGDFDANGALDVAAGEIHLVLNKHQPPLVTSIGGLYAGSAGSVEIQGAWLGAGTSVDVDGAPAALLSSSPTSLVVQVPAAAPGWQDVDVANALGSTSIASGLERWPTLAAGPAQIGKPLEIEIDNGATGIWVLGLSGAQGPALALPGIWHQLELALPALLKAGAFGPGPAPAVLSFVVPNDPVLAGAAAYAQAWALQGDPLGPHTQSFSNLLSIVVQ